MGFDNECILNIQSLAGEYFCPVCRLLVYPNEAMQSQCTHLYCKPCLTYVVGTTRACPYDGYLVTEADSKPLTESNKALADTIGKIAVHCLYHRSGCTWQGQLSECTTHCAGCAFGNSPVVCNRCGTQIVHRQVQEHAQNCPGTQPQTQQAEGSQDATGATTAAATATTEHNQATLQAGAPVSQANITQVAVAPNSAQNAVQVQPSSQPQVATQAVQTQEQWYQQQYQQYYQQYPGYDPYQQQYQNYDLYQQQVYQQQQMHAHIPQAVQGQQPQVYMQAQPQPHQQPQPQLQSQPPIRPQSQPQPQPQPQPPTPIASQPQMQAPHQQLQSAQPHPQMAPQTHPQLQGHQQPQVYPQLQPNAQPPSSQHQVQSHLPSRPQVQQHQQPHPQLQQSHPHTQPHPLPQPQHHSNVQPQPPSQSQPLVQPQTQLQPQAQPQPQPQAQPPPQPHLQAQQPPVHVVTGHQSYPQVHQQMPPGMVQQHPMHMHPQMQVGPQQLPQNTVQMQGQLPPQQLPQMRPPQSHAPMHQQQLAILPPQGQRPNMPPTQQLLHPLPQQTSQPIHPHPSMLPPHQQNVAQQQVHGHVVQSQVFPGQTLGLAHAQPPQPNLYVQQHTLQSLPRPQGPALTLPHVHQQLQQNVPIPHQSQSVAGLPGLSNHAVAHQPFQMPSSGPIGPAHAKLMPYSAVQPYPPRTNLRLQSSALPASPVPQSGAKAQISSNMKPELQAASATQNTDTKDAQGVELVTTRAENELKTVESEKSISEDKGKSSLESDDKEISESSHALEKDPAEKADEPVIKQMVKDEATTKLDSPSAAKDIDGALQIKQDHEELQGQADVHKKLSSQQEEILDGKVQKDVTDQLAHTVSGAVARSQTVGTSRTVPDRTSQNVNSQDRNLFNHQFPHQGIGQMHGSSFPRHGAVRIPDNQRLPGPPHMLDGNQRPPDPDQILLSSMAPPHQMQLPGQLPAHMRPQGHNLIPPQGNPSIPPGHYPSPIGKQLPGPFGPSVGSYNQGPMPPPHVAGYRLPGDSISGPPFGGPPPGGFDSQGGIMSRGPPHGSEAQQIPSNHMDAELLANRRVGYYDGRQSDSHPPGPPERVPFGQSSSMQAATLKTNGGLGKGMSGGLHDPSFPYLPEERFKSFPLDPGRHIIDCRDFEEDLKQFPRPSHLEGEPGSKFGSYFSSSRPLGLHLDGSAGAGTSRLLPPFQAGGSRPMGTRDDFLRSASDSGRFRMDGMPLIRSPGREFPGIPSSRFLCQEDIEGRGLESRLFGERSKPLSFPSDSSAFHESRFPMLPSHLRRGDPDGPGSLRISEPIGSSPLPIHLRAGEQLGLRAGLGAFPSHLRSGDVGGPGNLPLNLRIGESIGGHLQPGFGGGIPVHGYPNDGGFFNAGEDHSRKRKAGSMGWCRICKVDCESVEGLDFHSQTRDHQKKAMDMVLNIKKDNAKKQKIPSDDNAPHEDTNKSRKASFESRGN